MAKKPTYEELEQRVKKLEESERELVFKNKQLDSLMNNTRFGISSEERHFFALQTCLNAIFF